MTFPAWLRAVLPDDMATTWMTIRSVVPDGAYLVGGTAVATHLRHRVSRDLDFFLPGATDLAALRRRLEDVGRLAVTRQDEGTLNGLFNGTRIQFLDAGDSRSWNRSSRSRGSGWRAWETFSRRS